MPTFNRKTFFPFFKADPKPARFNIPVSQKSRQLLKAAKSAIENADLGLALETLSKLDSPLLATELLSLKSRLSEYTKEKHHGVLTFEHDSVGYNRLSRDIVALISRVEKELLTDENNYGEIRKYLIEKRYKPRVHQKLAGDQLFNLNVQYTTEGTTPEKAETFVTLQGRKTGEEIQQIFEKARRRLLVTGLPGAGKTSLLLNLALELLETDHENLAVLLNLATWRSDFPSFDDWLREILPAELGVTKRYAADILHAGKLTLLLDGLDEVAEEHRASCLKAIGEYGRLGRDYVISTRKDEYKATEVNAPVWAQIEVLPLTDKQLLAQLDRADRRDFPEAPDLKAALEHDPLLLRVAETPFYLNCLQLLFRGGNTLSELKLKGATMEERQEEITERFVERALGQNWIDKTPEQVRHWLAFLASRMIQRKKVVFELVDLQYDWWKFSKRIASSLASAIVFSLPLMVVILFTYLLMNYLVVQIRDELFNALYVAPLILFLKFILDLTSKYPLIIEVKGSTKWSLKYFLYHLKRSWKTTLFFMVIFCLCYGPLIGLTVGVIATIGDRIFNVIDYNYNSLLQITTPYQRFKASVWALHFSILQHWLLRWQLYRAGVLPLRLVDFLNEMTARHLLETDGATWRFRHRILQEHFAGLEI